MCEIIITTWYRWHLFHAGFKTDRLIAKSCSLDHSPNTQPWSPACKVITWENWRNQAKGVMEPNSLQKLSILSVKNFLLPVESGWMSSRYSVLTFKYVDEILWCTFKWPFQQLFTWCFSLQKVKFAYGFFFFFLSFLLFFIVYFSFLFLFFFAVWSLLRMKGLIPICPEKFTMPPGEKPLSALQIFAFSSNQLFQKSRLIAAGRKQHRSNSSSPPLLLLGHLSRWTFWCLFHLLVLAWHASEYLTFRPRAVLRSCKSN